MIVLGFILVLVVFAVSAIAAGSNPRIFLDGISFLMVFFPPLMMVFFSGMGGDLARGVRALLNRKSGFAAAELRASSRVFKFLYRASIGSGFVASIMAAVLLLSSLHDRAEMGMYIAVGILAILYGLIIGIFLYLPAGVALRTKADGR
jgi:flagellar motor component MotA